MENKIEILEKILIDLDDNYTVSVPETRKNIDAAIGKIVKLFAIPVVVGRSEQCCEPLSEGFYLGTSCPKCKQPFRQNLK